VPGEDLGQGEAGDHALVAGEQGAGEARVDEARALGAAPEGAEQDRIRVHGRG
jgi:hypothetical protein